jgi:tRNA (guanine-N7-)-methyltransferase
MDKPVMPELTYNPTSFSQGRMDFAWEELSEQDRMHAYADWEAGKGLIGGDPRQRPGSHLLPVWGIDRPFFRALALTDSRGDNGAHLGELLASSRALEIEIGYGRGDFLLDRALRHPDRFLIGYETKTKATRLMLQRVERLQQQAATQHAPLWLSDDDARFNLPRAIPHGRVDIFHILFPDPWWKTQHIVKRLFSPPFVDLLAAKLRPGGLLHFKSDVQEYGELVRYLVEGHGGFAPHDPGLMERIGPFVPTHREHWSRVHGKPVYAYYFACRSAAGQAVR